MNRVNNAIFRIKLKLFGKATRLGLVKNTEFLNDETAPTSYTFYKTPVMSCNTGNRRIYELLSSDDPCMVGRIGTIEMGTLQAILDKNVGLIKEVGSERIYKVCNNAGFFPSTETAIDKFGEVYMDAAKQVDLAGVFEKHMEDMFFHEYAPNAELMQISSLGPYYFNSPWSRALEGKKVLIVHPFEYTIRSQYEKSRGGYAYLMLKKRCCLTLNCLH